MSDQQVAAIKLELAEMFKLQYINRKMYGLCLDMLCPAWVYSYYGTVPDDQLANSLMADVLSREDALI